MGMAAAYLSGGVIPVTILIYAIAALSCLCFVMLFRIRDHLMLKNPKLNVQELSFEVVVEEVLGWWGKVSVIMALVFTQAGFATAYIIFIATNLNLLYPVLPMRVYAVLLGVPLILLCWIRQLKFIYPVAMAGIGAIWLAVGTVVYYCIAGGLSTHGVDPALATRVNWSTLPVAFGVVV
jgi:amino acid permease